ncbi:hypothetical protein [Sphingomonas sp. 3-13AW]|uniref:hypothetical protein n=1 Tax=Sphingomonas sp. 3-13AW TaxID=3050450 RepID=UPI003BB54DE6
MRTYALTGGGLVAALFLSATPAAAQQNPFVPPSSGGLSKAQVQAIIRAEVARQAAQGGATSQQNNADGSVTAHMKGPKPPLAASGGSAVDGVPTQNGGVPTGVSTAAGGKPGDMGGNDPVSALLSAGGEFVGCVSATPVFKDKEGRRAYFTSKELKASNEAKRIARCG